MLRTRLTGLVAVLALPISGAAQTEPSTELADWIVTAGRIAQPPADVVAPTIVIDRDRIERSNVLDVAELLQFHAGLDIGRNGGPGQTTSVFIRGAESNHTLVLVNGVRINPGTIGSPALQNISPEMVERIEIVKGPRSTLYGTDAIGGVVNIITRRRAANGWVEATAGAGQDDTATASVDAGFTGANGWLGISAGHLATGGFPTLKENPIDRAHRNTSVRLDAGWRGDRSGGHVSHWQADGETEYLGFSFAGPAFAPPLEQDFRNSATEIGATASIRDGWDSALTLARVDDEIRQFDGPDYARTRRTTIDWHNEIRIGADQTLVGGVELVRETTDAASFGLVFDEETDIDALYLADTIRRDSHDLMLALRYTDHETFGSKTTWNVDYGYDFSPRLRLTAGAGSGFRAPDGTDRFGFGGNPGLAPETSTNLELAVAGTVGSGHDWRIGFFENRIDDLVTFDFDPTTFVGINRNLDRARIRGAEIGWRYQGADWQLSAAAQVQDPEDRTSGRTLPRRARRSVSGSFVRSIGEHDVGLDWLATGERPDSAFSDVVNAGYVLANVVARVRLPGSLTLHARVENLLDADYETAAGFDSPGRGLYLNLRYRR